MYRRLSSSQSQSTFAILLGRGRIRKAFLLSTLIMMAGLPSVFAGSLDVLPSARYWDDFGMRITLDSTNPCYVQDDLPTAEARYRCRFYFRLNHLNLSEGNGFVLFAAYNQAEQLQMSIEINKVSGENKLHGKIRQNDGTYLETSLGTDASIAEGWHALELDWQAIAATGSLGLWLDGTQLSGIQNADNGQGQIDMVRWGAVEGNDAASSGFFSLDYFESRRTTAIGLKCHDATAVSAAMDGWFTQFSMTNLVQIISAQCP